MDNSTIAKLNVGEMASFHLKFDASCFLKDNFTQLGVTDTFGRVHWVTEKEIIVMKEKWSQEFTKPNN